MAFPSVAVSHRSRSRGDPRHVVTPRLLERMNAKRCRTSGIWCT
jgi:hypothetical protein